MRLKARKSPPAAEADMTPMIDMVFQLIAFFMVLINFTEADQNERIKLPTAELAKPPDAPLESPVTLQVTDDGFVLYAGDQVPVTGVQPLLQREANVMRRLGQVPAGANVIIRADRAAKAGLVQELIETCQKVGFEKFSLRAQQEERL
jgi:biopolymer transport protein ExbD